MFSDNRRISIRQYRRMLILNTLGMSGLVLPRVLVEDGAALGFYSLLLCVLFLFLFLWVQERLRKSAFGRALQSPSSFRSFLEKTGLVVYLLILLLAGGFLLQLESAFVGEIMLPDVPKWLIMVLFLFTCAYGCMGGGEDQMRVGEFLYLIILIPFLLLFLFTLREIPIAPLLRIFKPEKFSFQMLLSGAVGALSFFLPFFFFLQRRQELVTKHRGLKAGFLALLISFILLGVLYLFTVSIFGQTGVKTQTWPVTHLMNKIVFPGGFLGNGVVLFSAFWILSVFLVLVEILHFLREKTIRITGCSHPRLLLTGLLAGIFLISIFMGTPERAEKLYRSFMSHAGIWLLLLASLFVTGCGIPPEQRDYVLAMGIERGDGAAYAITFGLPDLSKVADTEGGQETGTSITLSGDNLSDIIKAYRDWSGKTVDFEHVKAIVLNEKLLSSSDFKEALFSLAREEQFAEEALVFLAEGSCPEIMEASARETGAAGLYLENFYQNNPLMKKHGEVTLGDYYYACLKKESGEMVRAKASDLLVPVLVVTKERPTISRIIVLK